MDAIDYLNIRKRMCCKSICKDCPLSVYNNGSGVDCHKLEEDYSRKAIQIAVAWDKANPLKTRQTEFLKLYPDAAMNHGIIDIRPCQLDADYSDEICLNNGCDECMRKYWGEVIKNEPNT